VTIAGPPRCPLWCHLYGRPTVYRIKRPGNTQNGGTVLSVANLVAYSESGSSDSYSSFLVTIRLSRLVSEIFVCDRQTDRLSLVVTYFYTKNLSCTFSQPSILPHVLYCHYTYLKKCHYVIQIQAVQRIV